MNFYPSEWFSADQSVEVNERIARLERERGELISGLEDAANALHNDFEPDNQSRAYKNACALLARMKEHK